MPEPDRAAPPAPAGAGTWFGGRLALAERYVQHLASTGIDHGLIGPRELDRLWERHVLNCAALAPLLPPGVTVADLGTGAGLPGLVLAIARPDLTVILVDPLLRRTTWLSRVVADLELPQVSVRRARAEELVGELQVPVVTARALAPLGRLTGWAMPLLRPGGTLLALKGSTAADELARDADQIRAAGGVDPQVLAVPGSEEGGTVTVVRVRRGEATTGEDAPAASRQPAGHTRSGPAGAGSRAQRRPPGPSARR